MLRWTENTVQLLHYLKQKQFMIVKCPLGFKTLYKHLGVNGPMVGAEYNGFDGKFFGEEESFLKL